MASSRRADLALLFLRLSGLGLAFAHGLGKITSLAGGEGTGFVAGVAELGFPAPEAFAWAAAIAELAGGVLVALGLGTRIAAGFAACVMVVAGFLRHRALTRLLVMTGLATESPEVIAGWGSPEKALLYLVVFLAVMLLGPGRISLDHLLMRSRARRRASGGYRGIR